MAMLRERKRKILATFETAGVKAAAKRRFEEAARQIEPPPALAERLRKAVAQEQLYEIEQLWYYAEGQRGRLATQLLRLVAVLGEKYQVDELDAKYVFTGRTSMGIALALDVKEELETIDRLLKQLEEAAKTAQIGVIDLESLSEYADAGDIEQLNRLAQQIAEYLRDLAEQQGLASTARGYELTPKAYRLFQGRLLERIFSDLQASRTGRHDQATVGEGAVELQQTRPYEFGDCAARHGHSRIAH